MTMTVCIILFWVLCAKAAFNFGNALYYGGKREGRTITFDWWDYVIGGVIRVVLAVWLGLLLWR